MTNENLQYKNAMLALAVDQEITVPAPVGRFLRAASALMKWGGEYLFLFNEGDCIIKRTV